MTTREEFLSGLKAKAVKLEPVQIDGLPTIYLRPETMSDVRQSIERNEPARAMVEHLKADPLYIERGWARVIRDETGALLFDATDDSQMQMLREALDDVSPDISQKLRDAQSKLMQPTAAEVDSSGNSPSASS